MKTSQEWQSTGAEHLQHPGHGGGDQAGQPTDRQLQLGQVGVEHWEVEQEVGGGGGDGQEGEQELLLQYQ